MTCRDDVGTTGPDKSESKRYILVPNCFLGSMSADELVYIRWKGCSIQTVPSREDVITTKFPEEDYSILSQHRKINRYLEVRENK